MPYPELSGESVVYKVDDAYTITLDSYVDLSGIIGSKYENLSNVSSIVAPLGFIEKFQDGYRSVFTTDEEKAFLCIDDNTPDNWMGALAANRTPLICPIVYMTDKKDDIDTDGNFILPYDSANPTWYKQRSYLNGSNRQNGIWNWITYGLVGTTSSGNAVNERSSNLHWTIVGNGRMFYFIPSIQYTTNNLYPQIYYFGKMNSDRDGYGDISYVLNAAPYTTNVYDTAKISATNYMYAPTNYDVQSVYNLNIDIGRWSVGVLNINRKSSPIYIKPTVYHGSLFVSGSQSYTKITYPDLYTKRLYTSKLKVNDNNGYIGNLSGLLFVNNINPLFYPHGSVKDFGSKQVDQNTHIICGEVDHSAAKFHLTVDGGVKESGGTGLGVGTTANTVSKEIGIAGGAAGFDGRIAAIVFGNTQLTQLERQKLEGWAAHKYGLTGNLPNDHPYKTLVPTL